MGIDGRNCSPLICPTLNLTKVFPTAFKSTPTVSTGIRWFNIDNHAPPGGFVMRTRAINITRTQFILHMGSWSPEYEPNLANDTYLQGRQNVIGMTASWTACGRVFD